MESEIVSKMDLGTLTEKADRDAFFKLIRSKNVVFVVPRPEELKPRPPPKGVTIRFPEDYLWKIWQERDKQREEYEWKRTNS